MGAGHFVRRLTVAMIGMILLCASAYLGLGWAVWSHQVWLQDLLSWHDPYGERYIRFWEMYDEAAARLLPGDQDSDGVCDGYELFRHEDSRNPNNHSELDGKWKTDGFVVFVHEYVGDGVPPINAMCTPLWPSADKALELRGRLLNSSFVTAFPRGFKLRITPSPGYLFAAPGAPPEAKELIVPVERDGSFALDLRAAPDAADTELHLANAVTGEVLISARLKHRWDYPSLSPNVSIARPESNPANLEYQIDWQMAVPGADALVIEAARDEKGASWHRIAHLPPETTFCRVFQYRDSPTVGGRWPVSYTGPLKFRIVPVRFSQP